MVEGTHHRFTFDDYVRLEADSGVKHEFHSGQVFAMSGGTPEHAGVTANVGRLLGNALEGRVKRTAAGLATSQRKNDTFRLESLDCELALADVHRNPWAST